MSAQTQQENLQQSLLTRQSLGDEAVPEKRPFLKRAFGPIRKGALRAAILTLLASAMGTGIFNLPLRISEIGLIPFAVFIIACGLYSYLGMKMISEIVTEHGVGSYSEMAQKSYGSALRILSEIFLIIYPFGIAICFQVILPKFCVELLYDEFDMPLYDSKQDRKMETLNDEGNYARILINIITIAISMIFILQREIGVIKNMAYVGVGAVLFNVVVLIGTSMIGFIRIDEDGEQVVYHGVFKGDKSRVNWFSVHSNDDLGVVAQGIAAIFFCYVSHQLVFPLTADLKNPTKARLTKVFLRTHLVEFVVYVAIGVFGYLLLVEHEDIFEIEPLAIASISTQIMSLGKAFMVLALLVAISLSIFPSRVVLVEAFGIDDSKNVVHITICVVMSGLSCLIAITFTSVNSYFGLLGGTAGVMMAGGIPAICYWKLMDLKTRDFFMLGFILVVTLLAMTGAILSIVTPA